VDDARLHATLAECEIIAREAAAAVRDSSWMPKEVAATIAERQACVDVPCAGRSADWLDGWVAACETIAAELRAFKEIRGIDGSGGGRG
jgi:hypothetical protein